MGLLLHSLSMLEGFYIVSCVAHTVEQDWEAVGEAGFNFAWTNNNKANDTDMYAQSLAFFSVAWINFTQRATQHMCVCGDMRILSSTWDLQNLLENSLTRIWKSF